MIFVFTILTMEMCKILIISRYICLSTNLSGCDVCSRTRTARIFAERFCGYWREGGGDLFFGTWANTQQQTTHIHGTSESTSINNQHWSPAQILNSRPQTGYTHSWRINLYHQLSPSIFYQRPHCDHIAKLTDINSQMFRLPINVKVSSPTKLAAMFLSASPPNLPTLSYLAN